MQTAHEMDYQTSRKGAGLGLAGDAYRPPSDAYAFHPSAPLYEEHSPIIAQAYPYQQGDVKYVK